jgi:hypothetical protein
MRVTQALDRKETGSVATLAVGLQVVDDGAAQDVAPQRVLPERHRQLSLAFRALPSDASGTTPGAHCLPSRERASQRAATPDVPLNPTVLVAEAAGDTYGWRLAVATRLRQREAQLGEGTLGRRYPETSVLRTGQSRRTI